ncbi:MAG: glycosyltransferase family 9 protein, partial [Fimbriimonadaceae bacterium]
MSRRQLKGTSDLTGKDIRTLIWLKHRFIGDAVMATPLLRAVHDSGVEYSIIAAPHLAKLFEREPYSGRIDPVGRVSGFGGFFRQVRSLKSGNFERVFLVNRSARSALIARFAGIAERVGHDTEGRGPLLTHRARYDVQKFEAACYGDLARLVRLDCDDSRVFLTGVGSERDAQTVGVQPGSTS